jgi:hypothetical protein
VRTVRCCTAQVAWSSSDPAIASITAQGVLTARGAGQVRITASWRAGRARPCHCPRRRPGSSRSCCPRPAGGSPGFELSIRGTGFQHGATVRLGGAERPARVISSTEIRIDVSAEDVRLAGGFEVRVTTRARPSAPTSRTSSSSGSHPPGRSTCWGPRDDDAGLPVLTGGFFYDGDLNRYVEQFVTAGVLRIHQPATGPDTWD